MSRVAIGILLATVAAAGLASLVVQLVAARLVVPWTGAGIDTWAGAIAASLAGTALGSAAAARLTRQGVHSLAPPLALAAAATLLAALFVPILEWLGLDRFQPLTLRLLVFTAATAFPAAFFLAIPAVFAVERLSRGGTGTGLAAGGAFAASTLGCLAGVGLTGYWLIPAATLDAILYATAGMLLVLALVHLALGRGDSPAPPAAPVVAGRAFLSLPRANAIAFVASGCLLALELVAARLTARDLGGSLATWTGVIGVVLVATATGNAVGGWLADRLRADPRRGARALSTTLVLAAVSLVGVLVVSAVASNSDALRERLATWDRYAEVVVRGVVLFFTPGVLLGLVSPQLVRLTGSGGAAAGRVAAWGSLGAVAGALVTGLVLLGTLGSYATLFTAAILLLLAAALAAPLWRRPFTLLAASAVVGAAAVGGTLTQPGGGVLTESRYSTIRVDDDPDTPGVKVLLLDKLIHSYVKVSDPTYLHYQHEESQLDFLYAAPDPARVLVVGGGGYTFPRAAKTLKPQTEVDVVEIDPAVTETAVRHLGLDPSLGLTITHRDGRQFLEELAPPGHYDLITLDAVNDLSVPPHLLTAECARASKRALKPGGVYLVSVIDILDSGELWPAAVATLKNVYRHVELLDHTPRPRTWERSVYLIYASDAALDLEAMRETLESAGRKPHTFRVTDPHTLSRLGRNAPVLTDQYSPVDQLMQPVYRRR